MRDLYIISIILILAVIMHMIESNCPQHSPFYDELEEDQKRAQIMVKRVIDEKNKKRVRDYIKTSKSGLIRGCIMGYVLGSGGIYSAMISGGSYAIINPIMMSIGC